MAEGSSAFRVRPLNAAPAASERELPATGASGSILSKNGQDAKDVAWITKAALAAAIASDTAFSTIYAPITQGVRVYADATARDAAITVPTAGMQAYLTTPKVMTFYDGTAWRGEWVSTFDPVITQGGGAIAHTLELSEYRHDGPMIDWTFQVNLTAGGLGGPVSFTVPVTVYHADGKIREPAGGGMIFDASSATRIEVGCEADAVAGAFVAFYTNGIPVLANGDIWRIGIRYRWV